MISVVEKLFDPYILRKDKLLKKFNMHVLKSSKAKEFLQNAQKTSITEVSDVVHRLKENPSATNLLILLKTVTNTGSWVSTSYIRYLHSLIDFSQKSLKKKADDLQDDRIKMVLELLKSKDALVDHISDQEFFRAIYNELEYAYHNPNYESPIQTPKLNITLMLVSGVLNEVFSSPAFDRGAKHLINSHGIKYVSLDAKGTKGSQYNTLLIKDQIREYIKENPEEKIWLVGFSKGGLDALHYLIDDCQFANKHFVGLSTIATPIMGTDHISHWLIKSINSLHGFSKSKLYRYLNSKSDFLAKDFQKSLSPKYLKEWFQDNHESLPKNIFYTAVAFESNWLESHLWMKIAKLFFKNDTVNDGVVEAKNAFFPEYFNAKRLGIIKGHHLVGIRSSYYSQEALLEAHLVYLIYKKLL